jgi:putative solute:sodium symporter small subunit
VKSGEATVSEMQDFSYAALSVLGKVFIQPQHKTALDNALSWSVFQLADSTQQAMIMDEIVNFETLAASITDIRDEAYQQSKAQLISMVSPILGLSATDVRTKILPLELVSASVNSLSDEDIKLIEEAMPLYLIHNQSVLTDTKFLGFPFHYFYTAVFLLILFVVLCLIYCVRTDRINTKLNIVD